MRTKYRLSVRKVLGALLAHKCNCLAKGDTSAITGDNVIRRCISAGISISQDRTSVYLSVKPMVLQQLREITGSQDLFLDTEGPFFTLEGGKHEAELTHDEASTVLADIIRERTGITVDVTVSQESTRALFSEFEEYAA